MIQSPVLRGILALALLAFAAFCVQIVWTEGGPGTWLLVALALVALTFAVGLIFPDRRRIALRVVAAAVVLGYVAYFGVELVELLRGGNQPFVLGRPSALMAGLGILIWGVPLLVYTLSGRTRREHATARAAEADATGAVADRRTLDALEQAGADLTLPTEVRFYLELPSEGHARSAASIAEREGNAVELHPPVSGEGSWSCCVVQELAPTWENIRAARARFTELASALGGSVDGWEAAARSGP